MLLKGKARMELPLWLNRLRTQHSVCENAGSIPGLVQSVKDLALPRAMTYVADVAWLVAVAVA